jgi:hypothetical protein
MRNALIAGPALTLVAGVPAEADDSKVIGNGQSQQAATTDGQNTGQ